MPGIRRSPGMPAASRASSAACRSATLNDTSSQKFRFAQIGVAGKAGEPARLSSEGVPGAAGGVEQGGVAAQHAVREEALPEIEPDPLDGVELGRVGREW